MSVLFGGIALVAFWVGAYFLVRIILAVVRGQPKGVYAKKLVAAAIIFVVAIGVESATRESPSPAKVATNETQQVTDKKSAEQKGSDSNNLIKETEALLAEEKATENKVQSVPTQEVQQPAEKPKTKEDEEFEKNYAKLSNEHKKFYDETYKSLLEKEGLFSDHAYTEKEAREEAMTRALNKQKDADKAAAKVAKEQADNLAKAKEDLAKFENEHNVSYQDLGDGTFNIAITFKHGSISTFGIEDKNEYYDPDDKERMYMARECTKIVQMFNDAGVKVNHFSITMTGNVINSNGDKWEDTIGICEFDNQKFPKNDFKSFYDKCSRFWVMESK